jgi:hypothetical protein
MIYFLAPDETRPSGGIRHIYLTVDILRELGYDAAVFHGQPGFRCTWFEHETPIVARPFLELERGDILVIPEYGGARERPRTGTANVVVLNQNHFRTFINVGYEDRTNAAYPGWPNAKAVLVTSQAIEHFVNAAVKERLPVYRTRLAIDSTQFAPRRKRRLITLMRRKRLAEGEAVVQLFKRAGPAGWEITPIGELDQAAVAEILGEAAIFLSFSSEEGFGLPPAEAMAAGCYVIGYTGDGGHEFMRQEWCSPIADQDLVAFAAEVGRVAQWWDDDPNGVLNVAARGREFVTTTYTRESLQADLEVAFAEIAAAGSDARQTAPVKVTHWSVPIGPRGALVRARRRLWVRSK